MYFKLLTTECEYYTWLHLNLPHNADQVGYLLKALSYRVPKSFQWISGTTRTYEESKGTSLGMVSPPHSTRVHFSVLLLPAIIRFATPLKLRADQEEAAAAKRSELRAS